MRTFFPFLLSITLFFKATFAFAALGEAQTRIICIVYRVADFLGGLFLAVAVVMFLYAGYTYWQAGGDAKKIGEAHKGLLWAMIGTAVGLLAYAAPQLISNLIGGGQLDQIYCS